MAILIVFLATYSVYFLMSCSIFPWVPFYFSLFFPFNGFCPSSFHTCYLGVSLLCQVEVLEYEGVFWNSLRLFDNRIILQPSFEAMHNYSWKWRVHQVFPILSRVLFGPFILLLVLTYGRLVVWKLVLCCKIFKILVLIPKMFAPDRIAFFWFDIFFAQVFLAMCAVVLET